MATKQQEIILVAFKTYKRTTTHSNWPGLLSFYDQSRRVGAEWRPSWKIVAIFDFQMANRANVI